MKRRTFFGLVGAAAGATLVGTREASAATATRIDGNGMLVDLTACVGCRTCEAACADANGLPAPAEPSGEAGASTARRTTSDQQWVVVNRTETPGGEVFARQQCMHCVEPACTSACLTKALYKTEEGPVIWRADKCMGCRFCMVSCPFDVPKFEYHSANPRIQKCQMCWSRQKDGQKPACVEACPTGAVTFGKRSELLEIARQRIYTNPGKYVSHIYGEREAGGTNVLYISGVPFKDLGFQMGLDETSYPEHTRNFLTAVPVVLTLWPAFLLALRRSTAPQVAAPPVPESGANEEV
jgi:Fe-S-cluster-containing dehydrogenase component